MIKIVAIGLWVCIASLGSSYLVASLQTPAGEEAKADPTYIVGIDYRKTDGITVPIISEHRIQGYILAAFVYTMDGELVNKLATPPDPFILDEAFRAVYSSATFDVKNPERYDLTALTSSIKEAVNARYKQEIVHDVLVEQFDFLPKAPGAAAAAETSASSTPKS